MIQDSEKALRRKRIIHTIMFIILIVVFFCFIFPFILVVINVFKEKSDIIREPLSLIGAKKGFTLANFPEAMVKMNFWTVFGNSLIISHDRFHGYSLPGSDGSDRVSVRRHF